MATTTNLPNGNLSTWYYAVKWGIYHIEQSIERYKQVGVQSTYDEYQLKQLQDLEQFLKMSWDKWMDDLVAGQTEEEPICGV